MTTPALMFQGTGSDVGKSLLVAGLCRAFSRRGLKVRPFKPQNMSNNAAVTDDGGEIGRAQALQARAAGIPTSVHMNPVLLKPQSDVGAQIIVQGKVWTTARARDYYHLKPQLLDHVIESFDVISQNADLVLVEGAGSPAEANLRASDIANMGFAEAAQIPVILVGDIDRGGVIASIIGTWELLSPSDRRWLKGYVINKFRGDVSLFDPALDIIADHTGLKSAGIVPYWPDAARLPAEDGVVLQNAGRYDVKPEVSGNRRIQSIKIAVLHLPRIANFDDLDPLAAEEDINLVMVHAGEVIPGDCGLVILPGSKSTMADLRFLKAQGWDIDLLAHYRRGGYVMGICGGYQMLGRFVHDPDGVEGPAGSETGLGLLDVETTMEGDKTLRQSTGQTLAIDGVLDAGVPVSGYEIHMGRTVGPDRTRSWLSLRSEKHLSATAEADGAISRDGRVWGCYLHGVFANDVLRKIILERVGNQEWRSLHHFEEQIDKTLNALADHLEKNLDLDGMFSLARSCSK